LRIEFWKGKFMQAAEYFRNGFSCSESMIKWGVDEGLVGKDLLSAATSFSGGMGFECLCGAIAGAQMIIGALYGKDNKYGNPVVAREKAKEFVTKFATTHGGTCCRKLTQGMDMASPERKSHCLNMVESAEKILGEILAEKVAQ
jgi:C_GCAxxG_C_C family probable redox protein